MKRASSRKGFTLIELLIYITLTTVIVGLFVGILIAITNIESRQSSGSKATSELSFLMNTLTRMAHESVDFTVVTPTEIDFLVSTSTNPYTSYVVHLDAQNGQLLLDEDGPAGLKSSQLSSSNIHIDDITFTDRSSGASRAIDVSITATVFPNNDTQKLTRTVHSTIAPYLQDQ